MVPKAQCANLKEVGSFAHHVGGNLAVLRLAQFETQKPMMHKLCNAQEKNLGPPPQIPVENGTAMSTPPRGLWTCSYVVHH
jgi:hypothetical protein